MINEKGLCKALKNAYKRGGYGVMPKTVTTDEGGAWRRNSVVLNAATWAVECLTVDLPEEAAVQIVKDVGYLPVEAVEVSKGQPNQLLVEGTARSRYEMLQEQRGELIGTKKIPVIFKDRWQLYQTEGGVVYAFDTQLLQLIDFKAADPECFMSATGHLGIFMCGDTTIYIAPGQFSGADEGKIDHIADMDWENQRTYEDPAVNLSLFDESAVEPMAAEEE